MDYNYMIEKNQALLFTKEEVKKYIEEATKEIEDWKRNKEEWEVVLQLLSRSESYFISKSKK